MSPRRPPRLPITSGKIDQHLTAAARAFIEVGQALRTIRDERLYVDEYEAFEEYCKNRWDFGRSYAHRLIDAADMADLLPTGNIPLNERQMRELLPLKDDHEGMCEVMRAVFDSGLAVTAVRIADARDDYLAEHDQVPKSSTPAAELTESPEQTRARYPAAANAGGMPSRAIKEVSLHLPSEEFEAFKADVKLLETAWNSGSASEVVRQAIKLVAADLKALDLAA